MQHYLFFLRESHRVWVARFSYAIVCICVALIFSIVFLAGCGPLSKGQYYIPETASTTTTKATSAQSGQTEASLPETAAVNLRELPYVRNAFKEPESIGRGGLDDFYASTRGKVQHIATISGNSINVLKAFVAKGWTPIVMVQLQGRRPEILPMSAYDDRSSEISLQHPINFGERRVSYKDFEMYWAASSRSKCVLITPQQLTEANVRQVLERYLPAEAFQGISVRSR